MMLMGLKQPLKVGDHFPITLTFAHAGRSRRM
ncbi:MAG: copper chaperone PCu(A)C [Acetobacteraceae bacterium]